MKTNDEEVQEEEAMETSKSDDKQTMFNLTAVVADAKNKQELKRTNSDLVNPMAIANKAKLDKTKTKSGTIRPSRK